MRDSVQVERVGDIDALEALRPEWSSLYARAYGATPFQTPEWLLPWWRTFGNGELFSFAARAGDRLITLAPLFLHEWNGRRQVTFIGNGVSDHLDFLTEPEAEGVAAVLDAIAAERDRWDVCDLQDLSASSPLCGTGKYRAVQGAVRPQYTCMSVALPRASEQFHAALPHGLRRNLRRYREHLAQAGDVNWEKASDDRSFGELLEALFQLHGARWESRNGAGMLAGPAMAAFHREAAWNLWRRGLARLFAGRVNGRPIAVVYAFVDNGKAYSYQGGFDPAWAKFSPGQLILEHAMCELIKEGVHTFDFLRGEESYKSVWGAVPSPTYRLLLWHQAAPAELCAEAVTS